MALLLGVDAGTQGVKALVYDAGARRVVARGASGYDLLPVERAGAAEQHPQTWIDGAASAVAEALAGPGVEASAIAGIGVSGQQHGFVALDANDRVIRPAKLWCDTETAPEAAELSERLGRPIPAGFTASKILWLKRHEPEHFARLRRVLLPHDYLNLHLCGRAVMEAGDASGTGLFDSRARRFDAAACAAIDAGLEACLPPLVGPDDAVGTIRPQLAAEWGLPESAVVAPGSGDNMMSALGSGAVEEGVLVMSLGTSGTLFAHSAKPVLDPLGMIAPFCDATGGWLPLLCTMNCTTATEEVRAAFDADLDLLTREAAAEPPGCRGVSFLPYLAGERAPDWPHASGALVGLRGGALRRGLLFRAAIEGATFALLGGYARLRELGVVASEIRLVGGGSKNPLWRRVVADAFGLPLRFPVEPESAALGAALQAGAVATGCPVGEFVREQGVPLEADALLPAPDPAYEEAFERFGAAGSTLFGGL